MKKQPKTTLIGKITAIATFIGIVALSLSALCPTATNADYSSNYSSNVTLTLTVTDAAGVRGSVSRTVQIREFYTSCS